MHTLRCDGSSHMEDRLRLCSLWHQINVQMSRSSGKDILYQSLLDSALPIEKLQSFHEQIKRLNLSASLLTE